MTPRCTCVTGTCTACRIAACLPAVRLLAVAGGHRHPAWRVITDADLYLAGQFCFVSGDELLAELEGYLE